MYYKIISLILSSAQNPSSTSEVFIAQPDANKEALAGKLFALVEINSRRSEALKIINFLVNTLNHNYYQNEKIILRERISTLKVEHIFETALAKTNKELVEFLAREKINIPLADFNITAGIVYENELHFSNLGKNRCLLIYKHREEPTAAPGKIRSVTGPKPELSYKIADLSQSSKAQTPAGNGKNKKAIAKGGGAVKLFSNIVSGTIPTGGYFLFTNETLPEYLSSKQLIDTITKLPPAGAIAQIKNILGGINAYVSFLGILVKNTTGLKVVAEKEPTAEVSVETSISRLNSTEEKTEKLLMPSGFINFKKWLKIPGLVAAKIKTPNAADRSKKTFLIKDKIFFKKKQTWIFGKKIILLGRDILANLLNFIIYLFRAFTSREQAKILIGKIIAKIRSSKQNLEAKGQQVYSWVKGLNKRNKILLFAAAVCLLLFIISLSATGVKNKMEAEKIALDGLIKTVEQKQNQVDAHLLYNNEDGAKTILDELKGLIEKLPQETDAQKEYYGKIIEKNNQQLEKIRHVVAVETGAPMADFANLNKGAEVANIILAGNKIYAGDGKQKTVYTLDLSKNLVTAVAALNQPIKALNSPVLDKNKKIYYLNDNSIIQLNTETEEISNLTIGLPAGRENIIAAAGYNNLLYLLEKSSGQIYRYRKAEAGFSAGEKWMRDKADFSQAVSFSIDGQIYVLNSDGGVSKYLKGEKQDFSLKPIDPPLTAATKIIVSQDLEYIYILEPATKRLVIFNKTGQFLSQYQFNGLNDLKDFDVDETAKKIYFLDGTKVFAIDATHFEK
ncbi:MAG: hypothetical protein PHZ04_01565 [Patescibacteria group bacterium]|nr:hypothetical protein [Patescibacteria group bacterium]MDD5294564.1 hypothetical protein [Patescibacteria group bacterium]MDD5554931.1 hypothetical protein [Patescibacteria group bacterium]